MHAAEPIAERECRFVVLLEKVIVRRKKVSDIQQAKDAFASRLVAVRNMLTSPCGMPTLDNKRPTSTRDKGPVRLCLSSNTTAF